MKGTHEFKIMRKPNKNLSYSKEIIIVYFVCIKLNCMSGNIHIKSLTSVLFSSGSHFGCINSN